MMEPENLIKEVGIKLMDRDDQIEHVALVLKSISHPLRLKILYVLGD